MNISTIALTIVLILSGCATPTVTTISTCQQQQRVMRVYMAVSSMELDECIAKPGSICLEAANNLKIREQKLGVNYELFRRCIPELKKEDPDSNLSAFNELLDFNVRLNKVEKIIRSASKKGHF